VFLWLPSAEFALARVRERVRLGGHNVPEETVRRRYRPWRFYDNSGSRPRLVARGEGREQIVIVNGTLWRRITEGQHG
jgi:predicted ABC-type ATPase